MNRYAPSANPLRRRADDFGRTYFLVIRDLKGFHPAWEKAPTEQDR
jgi:hypothetical protein